VKLTFPTQFGGGYFKERVRALVPIVEGIDSTFFGKASDKEQKTLVQILAKLITGTTDSA